MHKCQWVYSKRDAKLMETVLTFFIAGFFTAFGWWAAEKVTIKIDTHYEEKQDDIRSTND